jgi:acyl carrier protein
MGFDSLAILEIQAEIERQLGVRFGDDAMETSSTPAVTISYVNDLLKTGA